MTTQQIRILRTQSIDPLSQIIASYSNVIHVFPTDEYGLHIFQPQTVYHSRPNKTQRAQALYPAIPSKHKTKPQQNKSDRVREKNQAQKLKKLPRGTLPPEAWHKQEQKRQTLLQQNTQKVTKKRKKQTKQVPVYMNIVDDTNNDNNHNKKTRRSTRNIKPSQKAIDSNLYIKTYEPQRTLIDEVVMSTDEDDDLYRDII